MQETIELNNGLDMPAIGFGTCEIAPDEVAARTVEQAIKAGYRLIDTAKLYGNEAGVGAAIRQTGVARRDLFIATKVWNDDLGYDRTLAAFDRSLEQLGLDYLDLYLIHWPATQARHESWRALETLYDMGRAKAVGVCNYTIEHLWSLMERSELLPMVNQIEFHPYVYREQRQLLEFCHEQGIAVQAYSPLSRFADAIPDSVREIAHRYQKTPQQVILRWCIQHDTVPIPRSRNPAHIKSNLDVFNFELSSKEMQAISSMSDGRRVTWDPAEMSI